MAGAETSPAGLETAPGADATAALLHRCAGGDRTAFSRLYEAWSARLHGVALRITRGPFARRRRHP